MKTLPEQLMEAEARAKAAEERATLADSKGFALEHKKTKDRNQELSSQNAELQITVEALTREKSELVRDNLRLKEIVARLETQLQETEKSVESRAGMRAVEILASVGQPAPVQSAPNTAPNSASVSSGSPSTGTGISRMVGWFKDRKSNSGNEDPSKL